MRKSPDEIHIAVLDKIVSIAETEFHDDSHHKYPRIRQLFNRTAFIKDLYKQFCETMIANDELVAMQERIAWMELMLHNKAKENED